MAGHGSVGRYNAGCRCERCRGAIADYRRARRRHGQDGGTPSSGPKGRTLGTSSSTPKASTGARSSAGPRTSPSGAGSRATAKVRAPSPSAAPFIAGMSPARLGWPRPGGRSRGPGQGVDSVGDVWRPVAGIPLSLAPTGAPAVAADPRRRPVHTGSVDPAPAGQLPDVERVRAMAARQLGQRASTPGGPFGGRSSTSSTRTLWRRLVGR